MQSTTAVKYQAILVKLRFFLPPSRGQLPKAAASPSHRCPEHRVSQERALKVPLSLVSSVRGPTLAAAVGTQRTRATSRHWLELPGSVSSSPHPNSLSESDSLL